MIEQIPKAELSEEVITGFVISVLCQKDNLIRRELTSHVVTTRAQLFRILNGISLKRRTDNTDGCQDPDVKRPRVTDTRFLGKCHRCGVRGHKQFECKSRKEDQVSKPSDYSTSTNKQDKTITCFSCGKTGHTSPTCPDKKRPGGLANKEVNLCGHDPSRSSLETSSGRH
ncbi:uncharacterized protein LOC124633025 [Helicoverpa zea]|uniref:uncharacterized protein LOC124630306 n=1 Tax=Helicoverpa zea TaxID=7113 RepID=UPI001F584129|nr:uncharacterized protein LOC124630306 [Helicoverpa zea]XP_047024070.1 uncharacterized protein LOC124633025 [Helicoverpa zea]